MIPLARGVDERHAVFSMYVTESVDKLRPTRGETQ